MSLSPVASQEDAVPEELNDKLTIDELALFLEKKENIPVTFCQKLKGMLLCEVLCRIKQHANRNVRPKDII